MGLSVDLPTCKKYEDYGTIPESHRNMTSFIRISSSKLICHENKGHFFFLDPELSCFDRP